MTAPHQRTARSGSDLRILRAAVFAAVCVVLAAAGHTLASCATVPPWTLGAGFLGVVLVAMPLAGRERSLAQIATLLAVGQTVLHTLFGLGRPSAGPMPGMSMGGMSMGAMSGSTMSGSTMSGAALSDAALVERAARFVCGTTAAAISPAQAHRILVDARLYQEAGAGMSSMHHTTDAPGVSVPLYREVLAA